MFVNLIFCAFFEIDFNIGLTTNTGHIYIESISKGVNTFTAGPNLDVEIELKQLKEHPISIPDEKRPYEYVYILLPRGTYGTNYQWKDGTELTQGGMIKLSNSRYLELDYLEKLDIALDTQREHELTPEEGIVLEVIVPQINPSNLQNAICKAVFYFSSSSSSVESAASQLKLIVSIVLVFTYAIITTFLVVYTNQRKKHKDN